MGIQVVHVARMLDHPSQQWRLGVDCFAHARLTGILVRPAQPLGNFNSGLGLAIGFPMVISLGRMLELHPYI